MRRHASRHQGIGASALRGFSLIEVLMAIFILGLGILGLAALFPVGIMQQRMSTDDAMGSIVANHAMSVIRAKVKPEDFGTFEAFGDFVAGYDHISPTLAGDWGWMRPGFRLDDLNTTQAFNEAGAIDIFSNWRVRQLINDPDAPQNVRTATEYWDGWPDDPSVPEAERPLFGIPFDLTGYDPAVVPPIPPSVIISQEERYYPMATQMTIGENRHRPQYVWDCMFRRFQGRIYVAVFVYRVHMPVGAAAYRTPENTEPNVFPRQSPSATAWRTPPLPVWMRLDDSTDQPIDTVPWNARVGGNPAGEPVNFVPGTKFNQVYDAGDPRQSWQQSRQWILDQNNNIHRVLSRSRRNSSEDANVELNNAIEPVWGVWDPLEMYFNDYPEAQVTFSPFWYLGTPDAWEDENSPLIGSWVYDQVVTDLWYLPVTIEVDTTGNGEPDTEVTLTPIFVTVKEL